jgi:hypothetical protein
LVEYHVHETLILLCYLFTSDYSIIVQPCCPIKQVTPLPPLSIFFANLGVAY